MNDFQEKRTKIGKFMYNFTNKVCLGIAKHKWLIYLLNYTWGIIMTLVGWLVIGFCLLFLKKKITKKEWFEHCYHICIFDNWGGLELGINFLTDNTPSDHTKCHECGHTIQNCLYGPLFIFLIAIPSAIRYWQQEIRERKGKTNKPYDQIWFEGSASYIGLSYIGNQYHNNLEYHK